MQSEHKTIDLVIAKVASIKPEDARLLRETAKRQPVHLARLFVRAFVLGEGKS